MSMATHLSQDSLRLLTFSFYVWTSLGLDYQPLSSTLLQPYSQFPVRGTAHII